jgi:hypothetical protein
MTALVMVTVASAALHKAPAQSPSTCRAIGGRVELRGLSEASGVAASRRTPGVLWVHNDSAHPVIFALDSEGTVKGRVRLTGASVVDWEDIAVGPCPQGSCIYLGDIGDNRGRRNAITVHRVAEPGPGDTATAPVETFHAAYPDGPHDAESLFVTRDSTVFVITKGDPGSVALYRFPPLISGPTVALERVGEPLATQGVDAKDRPTAADASPDGRWVALRTTHWVAFYRTEDLVSGRWREVFRADLSSLAEPRGEGVTFAGEDQIVLVGEAGDSRRGGGTFARLSCALAPR